MKKYWIILCFGIDFRVDRDSVRFVSEFVSFFEFELLLLVDVLGSRSHAPHNNRRGRFYFFFLLKRHKIHAA